MATSLLRKLGCEVDLASNGREAVDRVTATLYDFIFMDCQMPEMDGYEATQRIRRLGGAAARTPIIAMTANAMAGDRERCLEAGMDFYISKPMKATDLREAMERVLARAETTA